MSSFTSARQPRSGSPPSCSRDDDPSEHDKPRGQALVEFALILPVMMLIILGAIEAGFLVNQKGSQDRATAVVADWAADHPGDESWHAVAADQLPGCDVTVDEIGRPGIVTAAATCQYQPVATHGLWDGLPISSSESAVTSSPAPSASPEPSASVTP
jgi:hypothetical protein